MIFFLNLPAVVPPVTENLTFDFSGRVRHEDLSATGGYEGDSRTVGFGNLTNLKARYRLGVNYDLGSDSKMRLVYQKTYIDTEIDNGPSFDTSQDMLIEGYVTRTDGDNSLTVGRQKLNLGNERLLGSDEWSNSSRSWDAARFDQGDWSFTYGRLAINPTLDYDVALGVITRQSDLGETSLINKQNNANGNDVSHWTLAHSLMGELSSNTFYRATGAFQTGRVADRDHEAWAASAGVMFEVSDSTALYVEGSVASGGSQSDDTSNTFDQLYPSTHKFLGISDLQGFQNVEALVAGLTYRVSDDVSFGAAYHTFRLFDNEDGWYGIGGNVQGIDGSGSSGSDIGDEIDLSLNWNINKNFKLSAGWSQFTAGSFVDNTSALFDEAETFYLTVDFKF